MIMMYMRKWQNSEEYQKRGNFFLFHTGVHFYLQEKKRGEVMIPSFQSICMSVSISVCRPFSEMENFLFHHER